MKNNICYICGNANAIFCIDGKWYCRFHKDQFRRLKSIVTEV